MTIDLEKSLVMLQKADQEEENDWSSDSEQGDNLEYLDSKDDDDEDDNAIDGASTPLSGRPNAHGGLRSRRASPLEVYACMHHAFIHVIVRGGSGMGHGSGAPYNKI